MFAALQIALDAYLAKNLIISNRSLPRDLLIRRSLKETMAFTTLFPQMEFSVVASYNGSIWYGFLVLKFLEKNFLRAIGK